MLFVECVDCLFQDVSGNAGGEVRFLCHRRRRMRKMIWHVLVMTKFGVSPGRANNRLRVKHTRTEDPLVRKSFLWKSSKTRSIPCENWGLLLGCVKRRVYDFQSARFVHCKRRVSTGRNAQANVVPSYAIDSITSILGISDVEADRSCTNLPKGWVHIPQPTGTISEKLSPTALAPPTRL